MQSVFRYRPFELLLECSLPETVKIPLLDKSKCVFITHDLAILLGNVDSDSLDSASILECYLLRKTGDKISAIQLNVTNPKNAPRAIEDFSVLLHDEFVYIFGGRYSYRSEESDSEREDMDQDTNETKSNELFRFSVSSIKIFGSKDSESASPTVSWENMHIESAENRPSPRSRSSACFMPVDKLLFFGGVSSEGISLNDFWEFDLNFRKWRKLVDRHHNAPKGCAGASIYATSSRILVCGGRLQRVAMLTLNMDAHNPDWHVSTGACPSMREDAILHSVDSSNFLLIGGYSWSKEVKMADDDDEDENDHIRAAELGLDDYMSDASDGDDDELRGTLSTLNDPVWLYSVSSGGWIPLEVNLGLPNLRDCVIRTVANLSSSDPTNFSILAQGSIDEPGALLWLNLRQKTINDDSQFAQLDLRKLPLVSARLMFDHPIFYDFCIQLGQDANPPRRVRLQKNVLQSNSSFLKAVTSGRWAEQCQRLESLGNVPLFTLKGTDSGDLEIDLLILKCMFGVLTLENVARENISSILMLLHELIIFGWSENTAKLYDLFVNHIIEGNPSAIEQLVGDPFAPLFPSIEPEPMAESIMSAIIKANKWAMSLKYAERLLAVCGYRFPTFLRSQFCTLVMDELEHYIKRRPEVAHIPILAFARIAERVTFYGDFEFSSMIILPLKRFSKALKLEQGQNSLHDVAAQIISNLCNCSSLPDSQETLVAECLSQAVVFYIEESRSLTQAEIEQQAQICNSLPRLLTMLFTVKDEEELIFALLHANITSADLFAAMQQLARWTRHLTRLTESNEAILSRVGIFYALHYLGLHGRFASPALADEASGFLSRNFDFHCQVSILSRASNSLSPRLIQFVTINSSSLVVAHAIRKRIALCDYLSALRILQASSGLLVPPKHLQDIPEMGPLLHELMRTPIFSVAEEAEPVFPLNRNHTLLDRICYELTHTFDAYLASAAIFCSQFDATRHVFDNVAWRHALAMSLILTDQVDVPPPWLSHISVHNDLIVPLLVDSCFGQNIPNLIPYQFVVARGLKCRWLPLSIWMRARSLEPEDPTEEKLGFLLMAIEETLTAQVVNEFWPPTGPSYSIIHPTPQQEAWREANVFYHAAECNHSNMITKMLTLSPDLSLATKTFGKTALWIACANGSSRIVRLLLDAGADPNARADIYINEHRDRGSRTCLEIATERGYANVVEMLLDN